MEEWRNEVKTREDMQEGEEVAKLPDEILERIFARLFELGPDRRCVAQVHTFKIKKNSNGTYRQEIFLC